MEGEEEEEGETHGRRYGTRVVGGGVSFDLFFLHRFLFFPTRPPSPGREGKKEWRTKPEHEPGGE